MLTPPLTGLGCFNNLPVVTWLVATQQLDTRSPHPQGMYFSDYNIITCLHNETHKHASISICEKNIKYKINTTTHNNHYQYHIKYMYK